LFVIAVVNRTGISEIRAKANNRVSMNVSKCEHSALPRARIFQ
jgi:hypothetical protein